MAAILTKRTITSRFMGVVDVPLYEAPFNPLPAAVVGGWEFQRSSLWPTISSYATLGVFQPNNVIAVDTILMTPFVFNTVKYPTATTTISSYIAVGRSPIFFAAKLWGSYFVSNFSGDDIYNFWDMLAVLGVNTFTKNLNKKRLYSDSAVPGQILIGAGENLFISDLLEPAFGRMIAASGGNFHGYVAQKWGQPVVSVRKNLIRVNDILLTPNHSKVNLATDTTYVVLHVDFAHPLPTMVFFRTFSDVTGFGGYIQATFEQTDVSAAFDVNANWTNGGNDPKGANNFGHVMWSTGTNSLTPNMPGTVVQMTEAFGEYWLINFIPMTSKANDMLHSSGVASWRITRDINGIWYFGSNFDNRFVLTSFGLNLALHWPDAKLPFVNLPCYGSCVPVPLNVPAL